MNVFATTCNLPGALRISIFDGGTNPCSLPNEGDPSMRHIMLRSGSLLILETAWSVEMDRQDDGALVLVRVSDR